MKNVIYLFMVCIGCQAYADGFGILVEIQKGFVPYIAMQPIDAARGQAPEVPYICGLMDWPLPAADELNNHLKGIAESNYSLEGLNFSKLRDYEQYARSGHSVFGIAAQEDFGVARASGAVPRPAFAMPQLRPGGAPKPAAPVIEKLNKADVVNAKIVEITRKNTELQAELDQLLLTPQDNQKRIKEILKEKSDSANDIQILRAYLRFEEVFNRDIDLRMGNKKTTEEQAAIEKVVVYLGFLLDPSSVSGMTETFKLMGFRNALLGNFEECISAILNRAQIGLAKVTDAQIAGQELLSAINRNLDILKSDQSASKKSSAFSTMKSDQQKIDPLVFTANKALEIIKNEARIQPAISGIADEARRILEALTHINLQAKAAVREATPLAPKPISGAEPKPAAAAKPVQLGVAGMNMADLAAGLRRVGSPQAAVVVGGEDKPPVMPAQAALPHIPLPPPPKAGLRAAVAYDTDTDTDDDDYFDNTDVVPPVDPYTMIERVVNEWAAKEHDPWDPGVEAAINACVCGKVADQFGVIGNNRIMLAKAILKVREASYKAIGLESSLLGGRLKDLIDRFNEFNDDGLPNHVWATQKLKSQATGFAGMGLGLGAPRPGWGLPVAQAAQAAPLPLDPGLGLGAPGLGLGAPRPGLGMPVQAAAQAAAGVVGGVVEPVIPVVAAAAQAAPPPPPPLPAALGARIKANADRFLDAKKQETSTLGLAPKLVGQRNAKLTDFKTTIGKSGAKEALEQQLAAIKYSGTDLLQLAEVIRGVLAIIDPPGK